MSVSVRVCALHGVVGGYCVCMFKWICMRLSISVCSFVSVRFGQKECRGMMVTVRMSVSRERYECGC